MQRSTFHLSEILRTRPKTIESEEAPSSIVRYQWSLKRELRPGRYHLIRVGTRQPTIQSSLGTTATAATNTPSDQYAYDKRLTTTDEPPVIRLLSIFPGHRSDPITCELRYISPEHPPSYQAISYCWEGQDPSVTIHCDGHPLRITENLSAAIITLRRDDTSLLVWADAICIDQGSVEEKNSQVPLMRLIYQNAALVQIWLGNDTATQSVQEAFNLLRELYQAYNNLNWDFNFFVKQVGGEVLGSHRLPALRDSSWTSVLQLIQRPWFSRAWIIQEIVVSRRALLRCGNMSLDWNEFCFGYLFAINSGLLTFRIDTFRYAPTFSHLSSLIITYICFRDPAYQNLDLPSLLQSHRLVGATDPKDKIYALLGLSTGIESQAHELVPDYSLSTAQLYIDVSRAIILRCLALDVLGVPRTAPSPLVGNLPSWVVDWSAPHLANSLSQKNLQGDYIFDFNVTASLVAKQVSFRGSSLILNGYVFDPIVKVGKVMDPFTSITIDKLTKSKPSQNGPGNTLRIIHVYKVLKDWQGLLKSSFPTGSYPGTSVSLFEIFLRTIHFNRFPECLPIAAAIHSYGRFTFRIALYITSYLSRHQAILRFLNWHEAHRLSKHALFRAEENSRPTYTTDLIVSLVGRRMVLTRSGYLGVALGMAELGDCVAIVKGAKVPLILRPVEDTKWELIGDSYVHGIMHGEAFEEQKCKDMEIV